MPNPLPREFEQTTMPPYVLEPPDVVAIEGISLVPKPPYKIRPLEQLTIRIISDVLPRLQLQEEPFTVELDGTVFLKNIYGRVMVANLTIEEATEAIEKQIGKVLEDPKVFVALASQRTAPQITGERLIGQDGTIDLGPYGAVMVAGLTLKEAKEAIELHLSQFVIEPEISLRIAGYNSKFYYVFFEGPSGGGLSMLKNPITGNENVLDALINAGGLPPTASMRKIYIARPSPLGRECDQILPVDLVAITKRGRPETNYQLLPHDRVYVRAQPIDAFNGRVGKASGVIEGFLGRILLYVSTVQFLQGGGVNPFFFGGFVR
jgi:protein involved in polysaccharide export with SLBB domain